MGIKENMQKIATVSDSAADISSYSKDFSLVPPSEPEMIVFPKNGDEIAAVIIEASDHGVPVYPVSSKAHFNGGTIPRSGGICLDISGMKAIEMDTENHWGRLESGVTWEEYANALKKDGNRTTMPLLPHADRSVVMDWLEREIQTIPMFEYAEQLAGMWVVWGQGEKFATGSASSNTFGEEGNYAAGVNPQGPGTVDFFRLLQGSQGSLGVVHKAVVKYEPIPTMEKTYFIPAVEKLDELIDPVYDILRRRIGYECLIVNNMVLATMLGENADQITKLKAKLPPYTVLLVVGGLVRRPEEMIAYQDEYLNTTLKEKFPTISLDAKLAGAPGLEGTLPEMLRNPWPKEKTYWKHVYKGGCQELVFMTTLDKASKFNDVVFPLAAEMGYPVEDIGVYVQPVEGGRACQVTYSFYYGSAEKAAILDLYKAAIPAVYDAGGFFNRPYEWIAQYVYPKAPDYVQYLTRVKKMFDPNMVLSSGKLCF